MDERELNPPRPVWVLTPRFSAVDDVQPGLLYRWERDVEDTHWRGHVHCLRETAPGFRGPDFRGDVPASRLRERDPVTDWSPEIDGPR